MASKMLYWEDAIKLPDMQLMRFKQLDQTVQRDYLQALIQAEKTKPFRAKWSAKKSQDFFLVLVKNNQDVYRVKNIISAYEHYRKRLGKDIKTAIACAAQS